MPSSWTTLTTPRGPLRAAQWSPPPSAWARPSAVLVFHHGYGEHVQRYEQGRIRSERERAMREREKRRARVTECFVFLCSNPGACETNKSFPSSGEWNFEERRR